MKEVIEDIRLQVTDFNYVARCGHSISDQRGVGDFYYISAGNNLQYDIDAIEEFVHPSKTIPCEQCGSSKEVSSSSSSSSSSSYYIIIIVIIIIIITFGYLIK
jgi:hypothetical protein